MHNGKKTNCITKAHTKESAIIWYFSVTGANALLVIGCQLTPFKYYNLFKHSFYYSIYSLIFDIFLLFLIFLLMNATFTNVLKNN